MTGSGTVIASLPAGVATDAAGNTNTASTSTDNTVTFDTTAPSVTVAPAPGQPDPTNTGPILFRVVFSEPVTGFTDTDVALSGTAGATTAVVTGSGTTYQVEVSGMTGSGTVTVSVPAGAATDAVGNPNTASNESTVTFDTVRPAVTVAPAPGQDDPTNTGPILFAVEFSEPVTGFTGTDVTLSGTAGATTAVVTGSGATYQVEVSGMTGSGTVTVSVPAGAATDAAGNPNTASNDSTVTFDTTAPTVTLGSTAPDPTNADPIPVTATFSEPVTGFTAADVEVGNGTVENFAGSGATYSFDVVPAGQGEVTVDVPAGVATDAAGNPNLAADRLTRVFDSVAPSVTVEPAAGQDDPTDDSPVLFAVEFSEPVTGFTDADVTLSGTAGATTAVVTGSGATYQVEVSGMTGSGTVTVSVPAAAASDAAGNLSEVSNESTVTFVVGSAPFISVAPGGACVDPGQGTMNLVVGDPDDDPITVAVASSNTSLVPRGRVQVNLRRQEVTIRPLRNGGGRATVTLTVSDGFEDSSVAIAVVVGTPRADVLRGTSGPDMLFARRGADTVNGAAGDDLLCASSGDDRVSGGGGDDTLDGARGYDRLHGLAGADLLLGGRAPDRLFGGAGPDSMFGQVGNDRLTGGTGPDLFSGGPGRDRYLDFSARQGDHTR
jgi:Ca2+-binding RTX toxin-like protein